ncbi:elongator complex protein 6 [Cryptomeria japonica]|uniref:elongator complex protein 6 n=1 Tax=Cryptomeria japonica TaxID=3369 RepID=UPI0025AB5FBE|nr:elongator complex protein 6 [Cryptomeria japonica]XP_057862543.1 elongator complex protein 6 [Cryptomeria japonica]
MALLDEALHLEGNQLLQPGKVLLVKDCVATSGAFILTHLIKKILSGSSDSVVWSKASGQKVLQSGLVLFVGLSEPFTHYERIARKLGFNLSAYRDNGQFIFIDGLHLECKGSIGAMTENALIELYKSIHQTLYGCITLEGNMGCNCIVIDDVSLLEIAAHGSEDLVLDFLHYCRILSLEMGCSLVLLSHQDIYASQSDSRFIKHLEYFADMMIDVEPLNSGIATDVHGQITVIHRTSQEDGINSGEGNSPRNMVSNFHFRIKENLVQYFPPGKQF